jgi:hypothetical protein
VARRVLVVDWAKRDEAAVARARMVRRFRRMARLYLMRFAGSEFRLTPPVPESM